MARKPNQNESFLILNEVEEDDIKQGFALAGHNQWPDNIPGISKFSRKKAKNLRILRIEFREKIDKFRSAMSDMAYRVVQAFSVALGQKRDYFDQFFVKSTTFTRLLRYSSFIIILTIITTITITVTLQTLPLQVSCSSTANRIWRIRSGATYWYRIYYLCHTEERGWIAGKG